MFREEGRTLVKKEKKKGSLTEEENSSCVHGVKEGCVT